jgi:hypothetical protein
MAAPQSYPSPTSAETQAGAPFYHTGNPSAGESAMPTNEVPTLSLDEAREEALEAKQLEQLHNEMVAQIHPDLENSATVALAAASSAADAAAAIAASDAQQELARQVMSLGGVDVDVATETAQTPPYQMVEERAASPGGGAVGGIPGSSKRRSKVSRACDECRRKKVCALA